MILQTLLVSKDDHSAEALIKVLVQFGVVVDRSSAVDVALARLSEERFDQVIVDFDGDFDDNLGDKFGKPASPAASATVRFALLGAISGFGCADGAGRFVRRGTSSAHRPNF